MTHKKLQATTFSSIMTAGISVAFLNVIVCNIYFWLFSAISKYDAPVIFNVINITGSVIAIALIFAMIYFVSVNVFSSLRGLYYIFSFLIHSIAILLITNFTLEDGNNLPQKFIYLLCGFIIITGLTNIAFLPWLTSAQYSGTLRQNKNEDFDIKF